MNESKAARYHRLRRRAGLVSGTALVATLGGALWLRPELPAPIYVGLLGFACEVVALPAVYFRGFVVERRFGLSSEPAGVWWRDHTKALAIRAGFAATAIWIVYALIAWQPEIWWLPAATLASVAAVAFARFAPVLLLPLFFSVRPLDRPDLVQRLVSLSERAGVRVLGVYEWALGEKTRRANAALAGSGSTRRILVSDTLLAEYTDDEIEVILAHELAHHVHRDIPKTLALEFALLLVSFYAAAACLAAVWRPLGLTAPWDVRGLPVLLLAGGAVLTASAPLVNALSRRTERRADRYALTLTRRSDAFISAMRRLGSQNLVEESPSRAAVWLFHTHPPIEERIAAARESALGFRL